ncbi:complex I subunit 1 family protein [Rubrobacter radiotolerans]|uniref:NADH-quinone oxidoreductase subunit H n=1 Tax=Rubrobacter radiotolerans TaxID=42256 RepID=A0AB35T5K2_RUBRA|nr:NADH-quinone oxidoreductase subunit H [Rubrobacter radiotolerans]MDX5895159.1 NADH-quinone oxidoreductase subunit H [Rubrobacter radiotolerans]SMC07558.1 NADH dehydrogenase subunit H [Rubrobacter radiotolerans DSM 5868]
MNALFAMLLLVFAAYAVAVMESWLVTGRLRLAAPITSGLAMLGRESIVPRKPDRVFFEVAPPLLVISAMLAFAVLPFSPSLIVTNLATGALFVNAALAYVMVALIMAGWAPNGAYAMIGGWRFLGQVVAYSMLIVMPITAVAMRAESLVTTDIVTSQGGLPNIVYQPTGFVVFVVAAMAVCFLPPLDLPTAPGELAGGVEAEYTGWRLAVFRLGRLLLVVTLASSITVFYLGGWSGPFLPDWTWSLIKTLAVAALMLLSGRYVPRVSEADFLSWCWKLGIPLALLNIVIVGVMLLVETG